MASSSGFKHDFEVVRWAATQLPNLPHIQAHLREVADGLEKQSGEAADLLAQAGQLKSAADQEVAKAQKQVQLSEAKVANIVAEAEQAAAKLKSSV